MKIAVLEFAQEVNLLRISNYQPIIIPLLCLIAYIYSAKGDDSYA